MPIIELLQETDDPIIIEECIPILRKYLNKLNDEDFKALYKEIHRTIYDDKND